MNASTGRYKLPDRNVLAGGLAGLAAWGITLGLDRVGITVPSELVGLIVTGAAGAAAYMVPPTAADFLARLDGVVRKVGGAVSVADAGTVRSAAAAVERAVRMADRRG